MDGTGVAFGRAGELVMFGLCSPWLGSPASNVERFGHVLSISASASCSPWVTVSAQLYLMVIQLSRVNHSCRLA